MADETDNQNKTDTEEEAKPASEANLEEAREELLAEVDGASEEEIDSTSSSQAPVEDTPDTGETSEAEVEPTIVKCPPANFLCIVVLFASLLLASFTLPLSFSLSLIIADNLSLLNACPIANVGITIKRGEAS